MSKIYTLIDHMTPKRLEWLKELSEKGVSNRHKSNTGCHCMRLGWTRWVIDKDGKVVGERLTAVGRKKLDEAIGEGTP